jgi:hypothetical protein
MLLVVCRRESVVVAVFQAFGLFAGLLFVARSMKSYGKDSLLFFSIHLGDMDVSISKIVRYFTIDISH